MSATVEERADRFQRRQTGPWMTEIVGGIVVVRSRRRRRIEFVRLGVAFHDVYRLAIRRPIRRLVRAIDGRGPKPRALQ